MQYADYAIWQRDLLGDPDDPGSVLAGRWGTGGRRWPGCPRSWRCRPTGRGRRWRATAGIAAPLQVPAPVHAGLAALAREQGVTLFMVVQAALAVLLSRLGAGTDIPIGTPVAGRTDQALDDLVGFFVNTLVLRTDMSGDPSFRELLGRVREAWLGALEHQDVPFERLVEVLAPARSLARHPLFQVMLTLQNTGTAAPGAGLPGITATPVAAAAGAGQVRPGSLAVPEVTGADGRPAGLRGRGDRRGGPVRRGHRAGIAARLARVLAAVAADPQDPGARGRRCWSAAEREQCGGVERHRRGGAAVTLPGLFAAQAARTPDAVAVVCGDVDVSYGELDGAGGPAGAVCWPGGGRGRSRWWRWCWSARRSWWPRCWRCGRRGRRTCRWIRAIRRSGSRSCWPTRARRRVLAVAAVRRRLPAVAPVPVLVAGRAGAGRRAGRRGCRAGTGPARGAAGIRRM